MNKDDIYECREYLLEKLEALNYRKTYPAETKILEKLLIMTTFLQKDIN